MRPTDDTPHTVGSIHDALECIEGAQARREGKSADYNPYERATQPFTNWAAGWRRPGMYIGAET